MNLTQLKQIFTDNGCQEIYVKTLSANDNSKQQVYFAGNFEVLNIFPISDIYADRSEKGEDTFKATLNFSWINENKIISHAPNSKLILYPDYPEVRFSGFLKGCTDRPSELMTSRLPGRLLFLSVTKTGTLLGYVTGPTSETANDFLTLNNLKITGVFKVIPLKEIVNNRQKLIDELRRIHLTGWIDSKRLDRSGLEIACNSTNCGGYTLEAELGIRPNGYSEPDYLGYEIKQFKAANFDKIASEVITLMTPEPTGGCYTEEGIDYFIRTYGYEDRNGIEDRLNFGGIHKVGIKHPLTGLKLELDGFDPLVGKIRNAFGSISLIDKNDNVAASWSFASLIKHWNRKHNLACYVPAKAIKDSLKQQYYFGNKVLLGSGTDFQLFLTEMYNGHIYYDPGIKLENASSSNPHIKRRSQFRIKSRNLIDIYQDSETLDLLTQSS